MDGHIETTATAKILQFPVGGRAGHARRALLGSVQNENHPAPRIAYDSWYHEAAINEEAGKNA